MTNNRSRTRYSTALTRMLFAGLFVGVLSVGMALAASPLVLKLGHLQPPGDPTTKAAERFAQLVDQESNGQIQIKIFPNSQLGNEVAEVQGLQVGTQDFFIGSASPLTNYEKSIGVISLPYLFTSYKQAHDALDGSIGEKLAAPFPKHGFRIVSWWENGFRDFTNNVRPLATPEAFKGLKIRVLKSPVYVQMISSLGATPVPLAWGDLYTSMQQKIVDGEESPVAKIYSNKFYEVQKYLTNDHHIYDPAVLIVSEATWQKLSDSQQKIIQNAANQARDYERKLNEDQETADLQELQQLGMKVILHPDLKPFIAAVQPVWKPYLESEGAIIKAIQDTK